MANRVSQPCHSATCAGYIQPKNQLASLSNHAKSVDTNIDPAINGTSRTHIHPAVLAGVLVTTCLFSPARAQNVAAYGEISHFQPLGGALRSLTFASLTLLDNGILDLKAVYQPGTSMSDTMTSIFVDTDGDPSTSYSLYFAGFDTLLVIPGSQYGYRPYPMPPEPSTSPPPPSYSASSVQVTFSSSLLNLSVKNFNFAVVSEVQYSLYGSSGIQTYGLGQVATVPELRLDFMLVTGLVLVFMAAVRRSRHSQSFAVLPYSMKCKDSSSSRLQPDSCCTDVTLVTSRKTISQRSHSMRC
jgi:hypothetical protein